MEIHVAISKIAVAAEQALCHDLFTFYLFTYLIVTPDRSDRLSTPALGIPMLSLQCGASSLLFASISRATPHSPMQSTTRDLYVYLHFEYLSSSSYSVYPSLELTLIYTETIALFSADKLKT